MCVHDGISQAPRDPLVQSLIEECSPAVHDDLVAGMWRFRRTGVPAFFLRARVSILHYKFRADLKKLQLVGHPMIGLF